MITYRTHVSGSGLPAWTGCIPLALGLMFLISAVWYEVRFVFLGETTIGTIERFERRGSSRYVYINYQSRTGQNEQCRQTVLMRERFEIGQQVRIRYLPDDPKLGRIVTYFQLWQPLVGKLVLGAGCLVGALALFRFKSFLFPEQQRDPFDIQD